MNMADELENPFGQFTTEAEKYEGMWCVMEMKVAAMKDESFYFLLGMHESILANEQPISEILLDLENVVLLREVKDINKNQLKEIISDLEEGIVKIGGKVLKLKNFDKSYFGRSRSHRRGPLDVQWDWPYFWLRASGKSDVIKEEEIKVKLNKCGYEDLWNACEENLGFMVGGAYSPHIYLTAPIYILADAQIKENKLIFSVKYHKSVRSEDISISYGIEGDTPKHSRISFAPSDISSQKDDFYELQKIIDLPPGTKSIRFRTYYKDEEIDENWIHKLIEKIEEINPKWIVIEPLFSKREGGELTSGKRIFERNIGLETKVPSGDAFESAISNLMSVAGFEVIFAGKGFAAQGIDILAFCYLDVVVISCTIGNDIREKIRTLLPQINKLKEQLENYELIPAIFSPSNPEDIIYSDKMDVHEHKVALLLSHEIKEIYQAIQTTSVSKIREFVLNYIKSRMLTEV